MEFFEQNLKDRSRDLESSSSQPFYIGYNMMTNVWERDQENHLLAKLFHLEMTNLETVVFIQDVWSFL